MELRLRAVSGDRGARRQVGQIGGLEGKGGSRCRAYARVARRPAKGGVTVKGVME